MISKPQEITCINIRKVNKGLSKTSVKASIRSACFKTMAAMLLLSTASQFQGGRSKSRIALLEREVPKGSNSSAPGRIIFYLQS